MPQISLVITRLAQADLMRIYGFLNDLGAEQQALAVMQRLKASFITIQNKPNHGKSYTLSIDGEVLPSVREVYVPYGKSGYSYLAHYDELSHKLLILAVKHVREYNYRLDMLSFD